jgi:hypothetical protein
MCKKRRENDRFWPALLRIILKAEDQLRLPQKQYDQAGVRDLVLLFHMMANDTSPIPIINNAAPNMRKFCGAVIQGIIVRNNLGLVDSLPAS